MRASPRSDPVTLVASLGVAERRVENRDDVAEALAEPTDGLRRKGDLRDEHDRPEPAVEGRGARLEVDLRLAAPGWAVQQHVLADAFVQGCDDPLHRRPLVGGELTRLRLAGQRIADRRRRPLAARASTGRRDELERPGGSRPVVVRHPQREVDERRRNLVQHRADCHGVDPGRGAHADVGDDAADGATPESHGDDRSLAHAVRDLVRERSCERPRRDERIDGRKRHRASVLRRRDVGSSGRGLCPRPAGARRAPWDAGRAHVPCPRTSRASPGRIPPQWPATGIRPTSTSR